MAKTLLWNKKKNFWIIIQTDWLWVRLKISLSSFHGWYTKVEKNWWKLKKEKENKRASAESNYMLMSWLMPW